MIRAESGHPNLRAAVDERVLHLVWDDADPVVGDGAQVLGVEIGERKMTDLAFLLEVGEMLKRVKLAIVFVVPPMEL
jgi:hypothetical protein